MDTTKVANAAALMMNVLDEIEGEAELREVMVIAHIREPIEGEEMKWDSARVVCTNDDRFYMRGMIDGAHDTVRFGEPDDEPETDDPRDS